MIARVHVMRTLRARLDGVTVVSAPAGARVQVEWPRAFVGFGAVPFGALGMVSAAFAGLG